MQLQPRTELASRPSRRQWCVWGGKGRQKVLGPPFRPPPTPARRTVRVDAITGCKENLVVSRCRFWEELGRGHQGLGGQSAASPSAWHAGSVLAPQARGVCSAGILLGEKRDNQDEGTSCPLKGRPFVLPMTSPFQCLLSRPGHCAS